MAKEQSAGILVYRFKDKKLEVLIAHPGGPFFAKKDEGRWSIPKGWIDEGEEIIAAAKREFEEETGLAVPSADLIELGKITRKDGKDIWAWAVEADLDISAAASNTFELEWPPRSGRIQEFPEVDRIEWFDLDSASLKLQPAQTEFLNRLAKQLGVEFEPAASRQGTLF